ncbi:MAG: glutamyl-tRNA reductase [Cyclobacteriaceae bacterium]
MKNQIIVVELNHKSAPIEIREVISGNADRIKSILQNFEQGFPEIFVFSTCNRIAAYSFCENIEPIFDVFQSFCASITKEHLTILYNEDAVKHLFSTAAGLESQTIGEHEILGQIRNAFTSTDQRKNTGPILNELVNKAIHVGKRVRTETLIGKYAVSFAAITASLIKRTFGDISRISTVVYGTGEMAQIVLKMLNKIHIQNIYIVSQELERATTLAKSYHAIPVSYEEANETLDNAEVLIGATRTSSFIFSKSDMLTRKSANPALMVDLGMPRNFDPDISSIDRIKLYDLDDLKHTASEAIEKRKDEIILANEIVKEEVASYMEWYGFRDYVPLIKELRSNLEKTENETLKIVMEKSHDLNSDQKLVIEENINRAVKKILSRTINFYKEANNAQFRE